MEYYAVYGALTVRTKAGDFRKKIDLNEVNACIRMQNGEHKLTVFRSFDDAAKVALDGVDKKDPEQYPIFKVIFTGRAREFAYTFENGKTIAANEILINGMTVLSASLEHIGLQQMKGQFKPSLVNNQKLKISLRIKKLESEQSPGAEKNDSPVPLPQVEAKAGNVKPTSSPEQHTKTSARIKKPEPRQSSRSENIRLAASLTQINAKKENEKLALPKNHQKLKNSLRSQKSKTKQSPRVKSLSKSVDSKPGKSKTEENSKKARSVSPAIRQRSQHSSLRVSKMETPRIKSIQKNRAVTWRQRVRLAVLGFVHSVKDFCKTIYRKCFNSPASRSVLAQKNKLRAPHNPQQSTKSALLFRFPLIGTVKLTVDEHVAKPENSFSKRRKKM